MSLEKDFNGFQIQIVPTNLILVVLHIETNIYTDAQICTKNLQEFGAVYLLKLMEELVCLLKKRIGYTHHLE